MRPQQLCPWHGAPHPRLAGEAAVVEAEAAVVVAGTEVVGRSSQAHCGAEVLGGRYVLLQLLWPCERVRGAGVV